MDNQLQTEPTVTPTASRGIKRFLSYLIGRLFRVSLMVLAGVFLAIVALNYGGFIDKIMQERVEAAVMGMEFEAAMEHQPVEETRAAAIELRAQLTEAFGLNQPFLLRSARWTWEALTLDLGTSRIAQAAHGETKDSGQVVNVILDRLPNTLLLAGATNIILFFSSLFLALSLSRKYGSWQDRLFGSLSLISSIPNWVYGVILVIIFSQTLQWLPESGMIGGISVSHYGYRNRWLTAVGSISSWEYVRQVLEHMILPVLAMFLSLFFQSVYTWRMVFLITSHDDYVELAKAKGLPDRLLEKRYLLRPTLPAIITSFVLLVVTFWETSIALEVFFDWPGIGQLFLSAIRAMDRSLSAGIIVIFAYVLGLTILFLDIVYALVDPRVQVTSGGTTLHTATGGTFKKVWEIKLFQWRIEISTRQREHGLARRLRQVTHQTGANFHPRAIAARLRAAFSSKKPSGTHQAGALPPAHHPASTWRRARARFAASEIAGPLRELRRYPSAVFGLVLIILVSLMAIYTVIAIPYEESARLFREERGEKYKPPELAIPTWLNYFRKEKLPETKVLSSLDGSGQKEFVTIKGDTRQFNINFELDYNSRILPQDLVIHFETQYLAKMPLIDEMVWIRPDGSTYEFDRFRTPTRSYSVISQIVQERRNLTQGKGGVPAMEIFFGDPANPSSAGETAKATTGKYQLKIQGFTFEKDNTMDVDLVLQGQTYGLAGTDDKSRDLAPLLLWGAPITLAFGLIGAVGTTLLSMAIAGISIWYGGWVDELVQRLGEINLVIPTLPIAITVYFVYSKSVWVILGVVVGLSIFGSSLKTFRALFLQAKQAGYIEAAQAYGAGGMRIIIRYMLPRVLPMLIPRLVTLVPTYVFLEATLAYLGVSDLILPTWGRMVLESILNGALKGHYYWALEPAILLILTGAGFALLGFALDEILNPRLRTG